MLRRRLRPEPKQHRPDSKWVIEGRRKAVRAAASQDIVYYVSPPNSPVRRAYTILFVNIYLLLLIYKVLWSKVLFPCVTGSSTISTGTEI